MSNCSFAAAAPSYRRIRGKVERNVRYVGNLCALWQWYESVRLPLAGGDAALAALYRRAQQNVASGIAERELDAIGLTAGITADLAVGVRDLPVTLVRV